MAWSRPEVPLSDATGWAYDRRMASQDDTQGSRWDCLAEADPAAEFACQLDVLATSTLDIAILLAAIGTVGMAFVEVVKTAVGFRSVFQRWLLDWCVARRCAQLESLDGDIEAADVRSHLLRLAAGDDTGTALRAWWSQPTDQLFVRLRAASEVAIDFPDLHRPLFLFLVGDLRAAQAWLGLPEAERDDLPQRVRVDRAGIDRARLRGHLSTAASHRLEALEMHVQWWWSSVNQAFGIGSSLVVFLIVAPNTRTFAETGGFTLLAFGLMAGVLSPFAKDLKEGLKGLGLRQRWGPR